MSNEYEDIARAVKVDKLVDSLHAAGIAAGMNQAQILTAAQNLDTEGRKVAEHTARVHPASATTWGIVLNRLARRVEIAADPFAGLGV